ncbi:MAG: DUF4352 domain-containing protein [Ruminococcaceae bacterium]|nr:DUF4352 domain-containing protein [Oscillospiraceae bacterium]
MKKIITTILLGVLCLSLCACNTKNIVSNTMEDVTNKTFSLGEKAEIDDVEVTMVDVYESTGEAFSKPADGNVYVICEFNIENNSSKDLTVSSMLSFEAYCDDSSCNLSISAMASNSEKKQLDGKIAPGKKLSGIIGYEVPADWSNMEIRYTPDPLKDDEVVFVATK